MRKCIEMIDVIDINTIKDAPWLSRIGQPEPAAGIMGTRAD
jgi:hypothetical protein